MDYKKAVKDKETEFDDLYKRMDADKDLVNLVEYVLKDASRSPKKIPNSVSVTLNDPAVFAAFVEAALGSATEQVVVEAEDKKLDATYIEDFIKAAIGAANTRRGTRGEWQLTPFINQQMCRRGGGVERCLFRMEDDILIPDIVPWDRRYVTYEMGEEGLEWAAYKTTRPKDVIEAEYSNIPGAEGKTREVIVSGKEAEVLDVWHKEGSEVWIAGKKEFEQPHNYGFTPVVLQIVSLGSMLADKDSMKYQGESIFFLIRDLIPELNRLVSIIQSINMKALDDALTWKSKDGLATPPDHDELTAPGGVTAAEIGGGPEPVPYGELKRSAWLLHSMIETRIQRGSLSNLDLGIMGNQPWSAVALVEIGEGRDQVFAPRLGARGLLNQQLAEMIIEQVRQIGGSVELGSRGHKRSFETSKLEGEYEVIYKYFVKSPKIDIARYSMASAAGDLISEKTKRTDILQLEDPDGEERQLAIEKAKRLSPAIQIDDIIRNLVDAGEDWWAELMSAEMGVSLKQMLAGGAEQIPKPEGREKPKPMVSMFGGGRGGRTEQTRREAEAPTEEAE